ncbi:MAG: glycosyltransferase [Sediminibacterium sp. Gen4]|jgi:glycosyltransferase involved in cell wall biosynthesis|uniref:glycosyltransferase n=1 Tax=unclassified Sediminibacterium TaxID=2635961 RepID=UPI0015C0E9F9|nr:MULTISPECIES: glycosyltransferase [unclassified Sediminibacterium]MBW0160201.1 glycosyltransferase [Sediminibacterium sp.]MBW0163763.1 glycosyltransferase [Sediminibacterium sp.]NWK67064.1 glycosyltransferase [Sediminibacterium sp. Gen4]
MKQKVIIIGSAWPLRGGGIATFNERLARQFLVEGDDVTIYSFSLQYPSFLFPGKSQYGTEPAPTDLTIRSVINSVNPFNWIRVGKKLRQERADLIVVRYWLPFMGPCLGTILRSVRKNRHTKIICIADNVIPHEKRPGDRAFTQYFIPPIHAFITLSEKVFHDLRMFTRKPAEVVIHPLYDNFGDTIPKTTAREALGLPKEEPIILFFGFIRAYKGLDILLRAIAILKQSGTTPPRLLIAGEFYEDQAKYESLIDELNIRDLLILKTDFIPDSEVRNYLCAADFVIQPYKHATQSGITPLSYHFEKPMLVTNVGALPAMVPHEKAGIVTEPDADAIAKGIQQLYSLGEEHFLFHLREEKKKYSWEVLTGAIRRLAKES